MLSLRQRMTVFGFFGGGLLTIRAGAWIRAPTRLAVVGGRVDTRPCEALRFGTLAQPISILPQGDRKFSILPFQFSIQQQDGGLGSGRPTGRLRSETLLCPFDTTIVS